MSIGDLRKQPELDTIQADICIIGSGPAGGILAAELAKRRLDVVVLEAGNTDPNHTSDHIAETNISPGVTDIRFGWSSQFGGSSHLWAGRMCPLDPIDFEQRSWIPESGWPFGAQVLRPYYQQAAEILAVPGYHYFANPDQACTKASAFDAGLDGAGDLEIKCSQWASSPFVVSRYLQKQGRDWPNLRVFLNAPVLCLNEKSDGSTVRSATITGSDQRPITVTARIFIIAAGGVETPRLLLSSRAVKAYGIGNHHDTVGRYFTSHPKADIAAIILNKSVSTAHPLFADQALGHGHMRFGIGFSAACQRRLQLMNHYVQLSPLLEHQTNHAFEAIKRTKVLDNPFIDRNRLMQGFLPGAGKLAFEAIHRVAKLQPRTKKLILRGFFDQYPDRANRISLSGQKKANGIDKVDVQWRYSDTDKQSVLKFFAHLDQSLHHFGIGQVNYSGLAELQEWPLIGLHSHLMGATRMGDNEKTSVTNADARVHGSRNLFIAGPSLFPTCGFANPFLTISALSLKLADHIANDLSSRRAA